MSRIAFCICGFIDTPPSTLSPLNGWFWLPGPSGPPPGAGAPGAFTTDRLVEYAWRMNMLHVDYDLIVTPSGGGVPGIRSGSFDAPISNIAGTPISEELDIIRQSGFVLFLGNDGFALLESALYQIFQDPSGLPLFPEFVIDISGVVGGDSSLSTNSEDGLGNPGTPTSVILSSASLPEFDSLPFYAFTVDGSPSTDTWEGTVTVDVTQWWSYDGIWDSATGAQIITPIPQGL